MLQASKPIDSVVDPSRAAEWRIPEGWSRFVTIDAHAAGEPLRIILEGHPVLPQGGVPLIRRFIRDKHDSLRKALMWEPRGHADMYGCIITQPDSTEADFGVVFLHNEGYSTMCGHGIIAVVKVVLDTGVVPVAGPITELRIETPAGQVTASGHMIGSVVDRVSFLNVPSFVVALDESIEVAGMGPVRYDLAFGGAYYAFVNAADVGLECRAADLRALIDAGMAIKHALMEERAIDHPGDPDLGFLYGTIFTGPSLTASSHSRNVCVFADGEVDRSPTGTGVSARAAILHARGQIAPGDWIEIESIIGSRFRVRVAGRTEFGGYQAVVPEVEGRAFITGRHEFVMDPEDPLSQGFFLR